MTISPPIQPAAQQNNANVICLTKLPPFRPSALRLMNISVESESAMQDFEEVFKSDPALTADLLLVANSAEYGLRSRIETIRHALTYMGLERVRSLGCSIAFTFYVRNHPKTEYTRSMWAHSIATAVIVEAIGARYDTHALYTAGLTHDLGRLAIFLSVGTQYSQALSQEFESMEEANTWEKAMFGVTHCEAGATVAHEWGFPDTLTGYMADHHKPCEGRPGDPMNLIRVACQIADTVGYPEVSRLDLQTPLELPVSLRNLAELDPERLREKITKRIAAFGG